MMKSLELNFVERRKMLLHKVVIQKIQRKRNDRFLIDKIYFVIAIMINL